MIKLYWNEWGEYMHKKIITVTMIILILISNLTFAATFEEAKAAAEQAGLEITWIDTDAANFMVQSSRIYESSDNRYVVDYLEDDYPYGIVINKETGEVIPTESYDGINQYSEGRAAVIRCDKTKQADGSYSVENLRYGFIDADGREVVPTIYDFADNFCNGLAVVKSGWMEGYIDYDGNLVLPMEYIWATRFNGGYAAVGKLDENGETVSGIIDKAGSFKEVRDVTAISEFKNGIARAWGWNKEIYIDVNGNEVEDVTEAKPDILNQFDTAENFHEGRAVVANYAEQYWQTKYGVIDEAGNFIIPMEYSHINNYSEGMTAAQFALGNHAYFDIDGKKMTPFKYSSAYDFNEGAAIVGTGSFYGDRKLVMGAVNKYGNEIVPLVFNQISSFSGGCALVGAGTGDYQYVNTSQKLGILKLPDTVSKDDRIKNIITVTLEGKEIIFDQDPIMDSNRVLVPIRPILEAMGADVAWSEDWLVTVTKGETKVDLRIGKAEALVNSEIFNMDVPAKLVSGRTMVPVRFITQCFGYDVDWDQDKRTVNITQKQ
jgi:uncharacterized protein YpmB